MHSAKRKHIGSYLNNAKSRAKRDNVPFDLTIDYLESISTDECPVFHTPFDWGASGLGKGQAKEFGPTLDRIEPEKGYVEGNVAFISYKANRIKDNGTMQDHYDIADWIWNHIHAKEKSASSVSTKLDSHSQADAKRRAVLAARLGEDRDNSNHYCGTV